MNKMTCDDFIKRAKKVHHNKYDYTNTVYEGFHKECVIFCPTHGEFPQLASNHLRGRGCPFCGKAKSSKKTTKKDFIKRAKDTYGDKYLFSLINKEYFSSKEKILIICKKHGVFEKTPDKFLNAKQGCPKCSRGIE